MALEMSIREAYGNTLVELGKENKNIVVLDADLSRSTMTRFFAAEFPERFFDCGIAEQNMMVIAAGLAASGKTVFASTFAVFASSRCYDQVRMSIAQPHQNVKIVASHGGVSVGEDGFSHHSIEDLALFCSFPGFTVIVPGDAIEAAQAVRAAASTYGPFYIRLSRPKTPLIFDDRYRFAVGRRGQGGDDERRMGCHRHRLWPDGGKGASGCRRSGARGHRVSRGEHAHP